MRSNLKFIFNSLLSVRSHLIHRIKLYTGRYSGAPVTSEIGKPGRFVILLLGSIAQYKNHKVLFDNWFTSPALMIELVKKGFYSLGTVRLCRAPGLSFATDREMVAHGRVSFDSLHLLA